MDDTREGTSEKEKAERAKRYKNHLFVLAIVLTPFIAVGSPLCFFTALHYYDPFTPTPQWFSETMFRFLAIAYSCFAWITALKYPLYQRKRAWVGKTGSPKHFYTVTLLSQLPYLILLKGYQEYWTTDIVSVEFARSVLFMIIVGCWAAVFLIYNTMIFTTPSVEE